MDDGPADTLKPSDIRARTPGDTNRMFLRLFVVIFDSFVISCLFSFVVVFSLSVVLCVCPCGRSDSLISPRHCFESAWSRFTVVFVDGLHVCRFVVVSCLFVVVVDVLCCCFKHLCGRFVPFCFHLESLSGCFSSFLLPF